MRTNRDLYTTGFRKQGRERHILIDYLRKYRMDKETGKATFAVVQAEDEIASIGMVIGAGWAGARAMTSSIRPSPYPASGCCALSATG